MKDNNVELVVDIRLQPDGQLSGIVKRGDQPYYLRELAGSDYVHLSVLAPEEELLKAYRENKDWDHHVRAF